MHILALTTATPRFDTCLYDSERDEVLAERSYEDEMSHAERSLVTIDEMMSSAGLTPAWIDAVACDLGPGSFTGVRVGLAGAKGIALALAVPLVGVSSLDAMAAAAFAEGRVDGDRVACVLDAKRGELFVASYARAQSDAVKASVVKLDELDDLLRGVACDRTLPRALWIARLAVEQTMDPNSIDDIEPIYAREPDARKPTAPPKLSRA